MTVRTSAYHQHLAAVNDDPEDDERRLAFARFIKPYEPALARFIQLQVTRVSFERRSGVRATAKLPAAERNLLAEGRAKWSRGVARLAHRGAEGCVFHRGFIAGITIDPEVFLEYEDPLMIEAPIRHVDFLPFRAGLLARLLESTALTRLDSIGFANLDDDAVEEIANSDALRRCLYLDFGDSELGPRAFSALANCSYARQLLVVRRGPRPEITWHLNALELVHGNLPWLQSKQSVSRYDVRWHVDRILSGRDDQLSAEDRR